MNSTPVQFYPDAAKSLIALTEALLVSVAARTRKPFYLALSGGETAQQLFALWRSRYNDPVRWKNVHFFWVDERCVSPDSEESNFYWANHLFFTPVEIPPEHIHRIRGEAPLYTRYSLFTLTSNAKFSCAKARRDLGYHARDLNATLRDTVLSLMRQGRVKRKKVPAMLLVK